MKKIRFFIFSSLSVFFFILLIIDIPVGQNIISGYAIELFGGHTPGYSKLTTSGEIIDPTNQIIENGVIDPDKYLREFNYGRVSTLDNGTVLREFTIIASDNLVKEISPEYSITYGHSMEQFPDQQ